MPRPGDAPAPQPLTACGVSMVNSPGRRRSSPAGFQAGIVELCQREDRPIGQAAKAADPDQTAEAPANRAEPDSRAHYYGRLPCADRRELAELRRENRKLREDVETLKRAAAIFAAATS